MSDSQSPIIVETPWWQKLRSEPVVFVSPLSREECLQHLQAAIDPWWKPFGNRPVLGYLSATGAILRRRTWYRNSFQTMARLSFREDGRGTCIDCRFGANAMVLFFVAVWAVLIMVGFASYLVTQSRAPSQANIPVLPFMLMPVVLIVGLGLAWIVGRRSAVADRQVLTDFIRSTLPASETGTRV